MLNFCLACQCRPPPSAQAFGGQIEGREQKQGPEYPLGEVAELELHDYDNVPERLYDDLAHGVPEDDHQQDRQKQYASGRK
jgi:hypothetical protein